MPRWRRGSSGHPSVLFRADGKNETLASRVERAADFGRHFDLPLRAASGDQGRIQPLKNVTQRQSDQDPVPIVFGCEDVGQRLA
jgi:hypothetical protein